MQITTEAMMQLRIASVGDAADGIRTFELRPDDGAELPPFTAGAHVTVRAPNGMLRKYSLCNDPNERERYVIAVKRDPNGQGGSLSMHDAAHEGMILPTSLPENAFPLVDTRAGYLFIAGGIGITPILSMIRSFGELPPVPWKLYYFTQSPQTTAFLDELSAPELRKNVVIHHDCGDAAQAFDLWPVLEKPSSKHIYCCGPRGLMEAVRDMAGHWNDANLHFESFAQGGATRQDDRPFTVRLAASGREFEVPVGTSILDALRAGGCEVRASCESGTCGTCRTRLLEGVADHRDMVLMPDEMGDFIMPCVSRAKTDTIVIDL